jgi:hypothetical protein
MALTGDVLSEEDIARAEGHRASVAEPDIDGAGEGDDPAASWGPMPIDDMGSEIISKKEAFS